MQLEHRLHVGAAPAISSFLTQHGFNGLSKHNWKMRNIYILAFGAIYIKGLTVAV